MTQPTTSAPVTSATSAPKSFDKPDPKLAVSGARASESGDPVVQRLLAIRDVHLSNRDAIDPPIVNESGLEAVDAAIADVDDELAEMGFPQEPPKDRKARLQRDAKAAAEKVQAAAKRHADRVEARAQARAK